MGDKCRHEGHDCIECSLEDLDQRVSDLGHTHRRLEQLEAVIKSMDTRLLIAEQRQPAGANNLGQRIEDLETVVGGHIRAMRPSDTDTGFTPVGVYREDQGKWLEPWDRIRSRAYGDLKGRAEPGPLRQYADELQVSHSHIADALRMAASKLEGRL